MYIYLIQVLSIHAVNICDIDIKYPHRPIHMQLKFIQDMIAQPFKTWVSRQHLLRTFWLFHKEDGVAGHHQNHQENDPEGDSSRFPF